MFRKVILLCLVFLFSANLLFAIGQGRKTKLHEAAEKGDVETVKKFVQKKKEVNAIYMWGTTALHDAAKNGHSEVVAILIDAGANIEARDVAGQTPIYFAVRNSHGEVFNKLVAGGANLKSMTDDNGSLLHEVALCKTGNNEITDVVMNVGLDVNQKTKEMGTTPLAEAAANSANKAYAVAIANRLVLKGADVSLSGADGLTPLYSAAFFGNDKMVEFLLQSGAKPDATLKDGRTVLHFMFQGVGRVMLAKIVEWGKNSEGGSKSNAEEIIPNLMRDYQLTLKQLLDNGVPLNAVNQEGETALHTVLKNTIDRSYLNLVKALVDHGIEVNMKDKKGKTALSYLDQNKYKEIADYLKEHGAEN